MKRVDEGVRRGPVGGQVIGGQGVRALANELGTRIDRVRIGARPWRNKVIIEHFKLSIGDGVRLDTDRAAQENSREKSPDQRGLK